MALVQYDDGQFVYIDGVRYEVKRAFINPAAGGADTAFVSAVATKKIRVCMVVQGAAATATTLTFKSKPGGASSAISATMTSPVNNAFVRPFNKYGYFQTVAGEALTVDTGAGSTQGVEIQYIEV